MRPILVGAIIAAIIFTYYWFSRPRYKRRIAELGAAAAEKAAAAERRSISAEYTNVVMTVLGGIVLLLFSLYFFLVFAIDAHPAAGIAGIGFLSGAIWSWVWSRRRWKRTKEREKSLALL